MKLRFLPFAVCLVCSVASRISVAQSGKPQSPSPLVPLVKLLAEVDDPAFHRDILLGIHKAVNGRRQMTMPAGWPAVSQKLLKSTDAAVRERTLELGVIFGDRHALAALESIARDRKHGLRKRESALKALVQRREAKTVLLLDALLNDVSLRGAAIRGLASYRDAETPRRLLTLYPKLNEAEKRDVRATLAARPEYATALLSAVEKKKVPRTDLSAFLIRQMSAFRNRSVDERIRKVWGTVRPVKKERAALVRRFKQMLSPRTLKRADRVRGRLLFRKTCASCHRLFDDGKRIGPELTGAQRHNLDYLLENLLDPNAVIGRDYRMSIIATKSGRLITGIVKEESAKVLKLQTANEVVILDKSDIEIRKQSKVSLMPEGQLDKLKKTEVRDLFRYLMSREQVPLPTGGVSR